MRTIIRIIIVDIINGAWYTYYPLRNKAKQQCFRITSDIRYNTQSSLETGNRSTAYVVLRKVQAATTCDGRNVRAHRKMGQGDALTTMKSTHVAESNHKVHRE